jgi:hypothetical protein
MNISKSSRCELPIFEHPIVTSGLLGLQYSMLQACPKDLTPALINHYINISMNVDSRSEYSHIYDDNWLCKEGVMHWHHMTWHKEMFRNAHERLISLIVDFISRDYYVFGHYNAYYIGAEYAYNCYNTCSHYLIYGFDFEKKYFLSIGNTQNNVFEKYFISFDEYINSVLGRTDEYLNLNFVKYNDAFEVKSNFKKIYNGIFDYLNGSHKDDGIILDKRLHHPQYGLSCYNSFIDNLATQHNFRKGIDPLSYKIFLEHHMLMQIRIDYLVECGAIKNTNLSEEHKTICDWSKKVYVQCQKYNQVYSPELIKSIILLIQSIITTEKLILNCILIELKDCISTTN